MSSRPFHYACALIALALWPFQSTAQTHFIEEVAAFATAPDADYETLVSFDTPAGTITDIQVSVVRMVVEGDASETDLIRVQPQIGTGKPPVSLTVNGDSLTVKENGTLQVASVGASIPDPAPATLPAGYTYVDVSVVYLPGYTFASSETWSLQVLEQDTEREYAGFADGPCLPDGGANDCFASVTQPYLEVDLPTIGTSPTLQFGNVQTNLPTDATPQNAFAIRNVGTATLNVNGALEPAGTVFERYSTAPPPLAPMENSPDLTTIGIEYRPIELGGDNSNQATLDIESNAQNGTVSVALNGTGVTLNAAFLLDVSGSMNDDAAGNFVGGGRDSRLGQAKTAGLQYFQLYRELTGDNALFGLYSFPDVTRTGTASAATHQGMSTNLAAVGPVSSFLSHGGLGLTAAGNTPMAEGIALAQSELNTGAHQEPMILLLSDGDHNLDSAAPNEEPEDWIPELDAAGIRVYTVGYGTEASGSVNFDLLADLAEGTGGQELPAIVDPADPGSVADLRKAFRGALVDVLGLREPEDPVATISDGQRNTHDVCIDRSDYTASFILDWGADQPNAMGLTLESPTGEIITPASAGVSYHSDATYAMYVIKGDRIRGGAGAGNWEMRVDANDGIGSNVPYVYSVLTSSPYQPKPTFNFDRLLTDAASVLTLDLSHLPKARREGLVASAAFTAPATSLQNFVAEAQVDWDVVQRVQAELGMNTAPKLRDAKSDVIQRQAPDGASIFEAKLAALAASDQHFVAEKRRGQIAFYDDGTRGDRVAGDGIYVSDGVEMVADGIFELDITILDPVPESCLQGRFDLGKYVAVALSEATLHEAVAFRSLDEVTFLDPAFSGFTDISAGPDSAVGAVVVTPRDSRGNLWGIGRAGDVRLDYAGATPLSPVIDNWDGSYVQVIRHARGAPPEVRVQVGGVAAQPVVLPELPGGTGGGTGTQTGSGQNNRFWWMLLTIVAVLAVMLLLRRITIGGT